MSPQVPLDSSFCLFLLRKISFVSCFLLLCFHCCLPSSSLCLSWFPASSSSKFTSHHPLSQTVSEWVATCRVQHGELKSKNTKNYYSQLIRLWDKEVKRGVWGGGGVSWWGVVVGGTEWRETSGKKDELLESAFSFIIVTGIILGKWPQTVCVCVLVLSLSGCCVSLQAVCGWKCVWEFCVHTRGL